MKCDTCWIEAGLECFLIVFFLVRLVPLVVFQYVLYPGEEQKEATKNRRRIQNEKGTNGWFDTVNYFEATNKSELVTCDHIPQDVVENSTISEVLNFDLSINPRLDTKRFTIAGSNSHGLVNFEVSSLQTDVELFRASEPERLCILIIDELKREYSHSYEVASVDPLETLGDHCLDSKEVGAFCGPVSGGARTVLFSSEHDGGLAIDEVLVRCVEDGFFFTTGHVDGGWSDFFDHLVDDPHVGKGSSCHDLVVSSSRAIGVEVQGLYAVLCEVPGGRRLARYFTGG